MITDLFEGKINNARDAMRFIYAGNALFTIVSKKTGKRFTFKVQNKEKKTSKLRFVKVLNGPDNTSQYLYLGYLNTSLPGAMNPGKKGRAPADSYKALAWTVKQLATGKLPEALEIYHSGKCGCCGRTLTVPESIQTGLGPICAGRQ